MCNINTKTNENLKLSFGENYKVHSSEFKEITDSISNFLQTMYDANKDVSINEKMTYQCIESSANEIRQKINSKRKRLENELVNILSIASNTLQMRFDSYWNKNIKLKKELESEKSELFSQLSKLNIVEKEKNDSLNNELNNILADRKNIINSLNNDITKLQEDKSTLGLFQIKKKKEINIQISEKKSKINDIQRANLDLKKNAELKICEINDYIHKRVESINKRIKDIDNELTMNR